MAGEFTNTLASPISMPSVTKDKLVHYEVDVANQRCTVRIHRLDGDGNVAKKITESFTLTSGDFATLSDIVFTAAQSAGITPSGTIAEE